MHHHGRFFFTANAEGTQGDNRKAREKNSFPCYSVTDEATTYIDVLFMDAIYIENMRQRCSVILYNFFLKIFVNFIVSEL